MERLRVAVLISGRGSNMQALVESCRKANAPAEVVLVISNVPQAAGMDYAENSGVPTALINHRDYMSREAFESAICTRLDETQIDLVCLAGFMRLLTPRFVKQWHDRLINIHPSLLPAYKGLDTHKRVIADGVRITGCTVHFVRSKMDEGPIIIQAAVPVAPCDDAQTLAVRVLAAEHYCYPIAMRMIAEARVNVIDEVVLIEGVHTSASRLVNPEIRRDA